MLSSRTTTTGHAAWAAAYLLTEPSTIAAKPPAPRAPTTSMDASAPLSTIASAGGPDSRPVVTGNPGAAASDPELAASSARADIARRASAIAAGEAL